MRHPPRGFQVTQTQLPRRRSPAGASTNDTWQSDDPPSRVVYGRNRTVTDHKLFVSRSAVQRADGSVDDGACRHS
jgi:hypothetical protein